MCKNKPRNRQKKYSNMLVIRPIHPDCQAAFDLLSTVVQVNQVIRIINNNNDVIHENDDEVSILHLVIEVMITM